MSSRRAWGFSIPTGAHFLLSGSDSSFSISVLSPISSNWVKWVHRPWDSEAGESEGLLGKSNKVETGLQLSSETTDKTDLRSGAFVSSGEQRPSSAAPSHFSSGSSLTWGPHESSFVSWLMESEERLSVFVFASSSERIKRKKMFHTVWERPTLTGGWDQGEEGKAWLVHLCSNPHLVSWN